MKKYLRRFFQFLGFALMGTGSVLDIHTGGGFGKEIGAAGAAVFLASFLFPKAQDVEAAEHMKVRSLPSKSLAAVPETERDALSTLYEKAQQDYVAIEQTSAAIADEALRDELAALQPISVRIMDYMGAHPEKIPMARKFVTYYQDRTAALAKEFLEFEHTGLATEQVEATKTKIRETLAAMDEAYTAEFERLLTDKLLDVDAELKVMEQTLAAEGIEDKGNDGAELPKPDETPQTDAPTGQRTWAERLADRAKQEAEQEKARKEGLVAPWAGRPQAGRAHRGHGLGRGELIRRQGSDLAIIPAPLYDDVRRQRIVMSVLAIVLGTFGAHRFYQGRIGLGILYVLFCSTGLSTIISICEGIRYATMPLARFYEKIYRPVG